MCVNGGWMKREGWSERGKTLASEFVNETPSFGLLTFPTNAPIIAQGLKRLS